MTNGPQNGRLKAYPLTAEAFAPYGDVIEAGEGVRQLTINRGHTIRYDDLTRPDVSDKGGEAGISIFRSTPLEKPVPIRVMERHPLGSQAFMPLSGRPYLVVVAATGPFDPANLRAFLAAGRQGVNYRKGVWHHFCLALDAVSDFLVIDRYGAGDNLEEIDLPDSQTVTIDDVLSKTGPSVV